MATYSSATNPFLRATTSSNGFERPAKKEAPGMAILQNSQTKSLTDFMQGDLATPTQDANNNTLHEPNDLDNIVPDTKKSVDLTGDRAIEQHDDSKEIAETCQRLVDATIQRELEESDKKCRSESENFVVTEREVNKFNFIEINETDDEEEEEEIDLSGDSAPMVHDDRRYQHIELIKKLRLQLKDLEKYAYERGELDQVPPSVLAERQTVILETLKDRLSLNLKTDDIEKSDLEELKRQVDKEIHDLIDPLITKDYLLGQLKTQLTDLERYIAHLHKTIGKNSYKTNCSCRVHGCSESDKPASPSSLTSTEATYKNSSLMSNEALPRTSRLIRSLVTQLICSDAKIQESAKKEKNFEIQSEDNPPKRSEASANGSVIQTAPKFHDGAAWSLHIDKVVLATDSLVNLHTLEPKYQRPAERPIDDNLIESIVRRRLLPAIRDLLSYGLIDPLNNPRPSSYLSFIFDPYYLLSTLTCFPTSQNSTSNGTKEATVEKFHVWNVIEDYYESRSGPSFKSSSIKTLSQSFNLGASTSGPIKITSKQALLIAVDDIIETLAKCKPNGPESHFRSFIYAALNRSKLSTWLRLIFKNKSVVRKYYHNFSFVSQPDKMDKLLTTLDALSRIEFKLSTDVKSAELFVSAF